MGPHPSAKLPGFVISTNYRVFFLGESTESKLVVHELEGQLLAKKALTSWHTQYDVNGTEQLS